MALPAASRVFGIVELALQILDEASSGEQGMRILHALQRVGPGLRDIIQNTTRCKIKMGLQHELPGPLWYSTGSPQHSQAIAALKEDLSFAPLYAANDAVPGAAKSSDRFIGSTSRREYDGLWMFHVDSVGWSKSIGVCGAQSIHCSPEASWRKIKLFARSASLCIGVAVRIGGESGQMLASPSARDVDGNEEADLDTWKRSRRARYMERVFLTADEATLGNVADILESILQRTEGMHRKLSAPSRETPHVMWHFGHSGPQELEDYEPETKADVSSLQDPLEYSDRELTASKTDELSEEHQLSIAIAESVEAEKKSEDLQLSIAIAMSMEVEKEAEDLRRALEVSMNLGS